MRSESPVAVATHQRFGSAPSVFHPRAIDGLTFGTSLLSSTNVLCNEIHVRSTIVLQSFCVQRSTPAMMTTRETRYRCYTCRGHPCARVAYLSVFLNSQRTFSSAYWQRGNVAALRWRACGNRTRSPPAILHAEGFHQYSADRDRALVEVVCDRNLQHCRRLCIISYTDINTFTG